MPSVVKSHRIRFAAAQVTIRVDPPVVIAPDGRIPANTKVYADFHVNGQLRKPDGLGPLFGTTPGAAPDTDEYTGVRWQWNPSDPRFGFTVLKGTILKDTVTIPITATLDGRQYTASVTFSRLASGEKGDPGAPTPPPMLWSDYPEGYEFQDGVTAVDGSPASRLDCVLALNTAPATKDEYPLCYYRCAKPHVKTTARRPKDGSEYWTRAHEFSTVATDVILAQNGFIKILSTQALKVYKSDGSTVNAAFGGGDWPAWFGAASPSDAPTKINADGTIYSRRGEFEGDVVFGGRVKPMVTRITSQNYTLYRGRWSEVLNDGSGDSTWILDFSRLSGRVILDASLSSVSESDLGLTFFVPSRYPSGTPPAKDTDGYNRICDCIGSAIAVRNDTSRTFSVSGYVSTDPDLAGSQTVFVGPSTELMLECRLRMVGGTRAVGWHILYRGPAV